MLDFKPTAYLTDQSGVNDWDGAWVFCAGRKRVVFHIKWSAFAGTAGTIRLDGAGTYNGATPAQASGPDLTADAIDLAPSSGVYGTGLTVGATAGGTIIDIENPTPWLRLGFVQTVPGTVDQFQAWVTLTD